jgi:hypothetical protein
MERIDVTLDQRSRRWGRPFRYRGSRATRARTRGTASIEAVIVIPVFIALFIGVAYVSRVAELGQSAEMTARSCAWLYSAQNCKGVPPGCEGYLRARTAVSTGGNKVDDALHGGKNSLPHGSSAQNFVSGVVGSLLESAIQDAFGRTLDASVPAATDQPELFGGKTVTVTGNYNLACNLAPTTLGDVAKDAWSLLP